MYSVRTSRGLSSGIVSCHTPSVLPIPAIGGFRETAVGNGFYGVPSYYVEPSPFASSLRYEICNLIMCLISIFFLVRCCTGLEGRYSHNSQNVDGTHQILTVRFCNRMCNSRYALPLQISMILGSSVKVIEGQPNTNSRSYQFILGKSVRPPYVCGVIQTSTV